MPSGNDNAQTESYISSLPESEVSYLNISDFRQTGLTVADWARSKKFSVRLVYAVLRGGRKCLRGQSYSIAKELGMK